MNKIPCASQNMEAKTLPADVCVFGRFGRLSPAAVHSDDCQFKSGVKWWIHVSSVVTCLHKNSFLLCWNSCKRHSELSMHCFWLTEQTWHPLWTRLFHWQMFMQNGEYTAFWYLQLLCYLTQLQFMIGQNEFMEFFDVFWDNCWIWATWTSSIICVCMIMIKLLLCLNSIFSNQKATHEIQIFPLFKKFATIALNCNL